MNRLLVLVLLLPGWAFAMELSDSLRINGFATLGASTVDHQGVTFTSYSNQAEGASKEQWDFGSGSILGFQAEWQIDDSLSFTTQSVSRQDEGGDVDTDFEWTYLSYDFGHDLTGRIGRFRLPVFKSTELAFVGYSRLYTRPPLTYYGVGGYDHFDGVELLYKTYWGDYDLSMMATYGAGEDRLPAENRTKVESDDMKSFSLKIEKDDYWVNVVYFHAQSDIGLQRGTETLDVSMASVEGGMKLWGADLLYGYGYGDVEVELPDEELFYVSLAYPVREWTPYALYAYKKFHNQEYLKNDEDQGENGGQPPATPPPVRPDPIDEVVMPAFSLGVRYDFRPGMACKLQWDRIDPSSSLIKGETSGIEVVNTLTLSLDMVF